MARYYVEDSPQWLIETPIEEYDEDFIKIIVFFNFMLQFQDNQLDVEL